MISPVLGAPREGQAGWGKPYESQVCHTGHLAFPEHKYHAIQGFCWTDIPVGDLSKPEHSCTG